VSVVCHNALNRCVNEYSLRDTGRILDRARDLVIENFAKSADEVKDGMDASLCAIDLGLRKIQWSGAHNPLWIYRLADQQIEMIRADKQPVGKSPNASPFTSHSFELTKGDIIYLFTDGNADQFGGENNKKLTCARFRDLLSQIAHLNMQDQKQQLLDFHEEYKGKNEQIDDICIIGVRI